MSALRRVISHHSSSLNPPHLVLLGNRFYVSNTSHLTKIHCAMKLFDRMIEMGIEPNECTCVALITGLCRTGNIHLALKVQNNMVRWNNFEPNVYSYCVIIDSLCKGGLLDEALNLFLQMINDAKIALNVVVYNTLINGL
ncbi:hypothetical protein C5167_041328 [Papaver somniferum]|uniref:Pentacotripeptide-repeat region of PRORP domain-containing protein n=1 Tax=Papaver somniferum TaxID=3469 RepID=A0A4Y7IJV9_PAPSO|nr:hypothetical protein C5167_041328 [Papaver somniferum]